MRETNAADKIGPNCKLRALRLPRGEDLCPRIFPKDTIMNGTHVYSYRMEGAKYGISFGSALAIAISYSNDHSILWAIVDGILSWIYVIYFALFR